MSYIGINFLNAEQKINMLVLYANNIVYCSYIVFYFSWMYGRKNLIFFHGYMRGKIVLLFEIKLTVLVSSFKMT